MPFQHTGSLRYFYFESLQAPGLVHAVLTRQGGVSPQPWDSLNLGGTVGDDLENVRQNRLRALQAFDLSPHSVFDVFQVHGNQVVCSTAPRPLETPHLKADAILTDKPGVTLLMRFADCVPILLFDPVRKVIGIAHAGWQGTLLRTAACAVDAMQLHYACRPADVLAAIGPSIAAHHYPVGPEVIHQVQRVFRDESRYLLHDGYGEDANNGVKFDLWSANRLVLHQAGVQQVDISNQCTACNLDDWYSHRGEAGKTGRFGALIALR